MAHYAFINSDNKVVEIIVGKDENDTDSLPSEFSSWEEYYESKREGLTCKRTSFNTIGNTHSEGGTPFRGNFAQIGGTYDAENDVFLENTEGHDGWTFDENYLLVPPTPQPEDTDTTTHKWDNDNQQWQEWTWNSNLEIWEISS